MMKDIQEELKDLLNHLGFIPEDFKINDTNLIQWGTLSVTPLKDVTTITRLATQKSKTYKSDYSSAWLVDFENDLKSGFFN
ncbi:Uncharacterised protein [Legionella steigerwaltii]|uniref:Uncharacterized protein n=1 Tax=Legionella steigerwaltii TaxID=460 RepID=A0A378LBM6_9GAMM|nr:hypothetical protein [Legionella steigerwaltii]KTD78534.1 hypothetical protein Lstg_1269 [Legionella steigerwaltii]STY24107.1 Uncharacterised protein [Legionella steigerwaltii]